MEIQLAYNHPQAQIKQVILDNGEVWHLKGECNKCGICCKNIEIPYLTDSKGCKHLKQENDKFVCGIYWFRPEFCMMYPVDPYQELYPECSFKWERIN